MQLTVLRVSEKNVHACMNHAQNLPKRAKTLVMVVVTTTGGELHVITISRVVSASIESRDKMITRLRLDKNMLYENYK